MLLKLASNTVSNVSKPTSRESEMKKRGGGERESANPYLAPKTRRYAQSRPRALWSR